MEKVLRSRTIVLPKQRRGLRLSLLELLFLASLSFVGVCIGTPICRYMLHHFAHLHPGAGWPVALALAISLLGGGLGLLRASRNPPCDTYGFVFALLYAVITWVFAFVFYEIGWGPSLFLLGLSLPGLAWALIYSEYTGFERFSFEGRAAVALSITWGCVLAFMFWLHPPRMCCYACSVENAAIAACKTYAEAQDIYRRTDWDSDGVLEYAQTISGNNSLYEKHAGSGDLTLVDAAFAFAEGPAGVAQTKAGYVFKVLKAQGANAPDGARSYLVNGNMTGGYALVCSPADYQPGRNTFLINQSGTVHQKDLGPDTASIVNEMSEYNLDTGWVVSE